MNGDRRSKKYLWPTLPGETEKDHRNMRCNWCP